MECSHLWKTSFYCHVPIYRILRIAYAKKQLRWAYSKRTGTSTVSVNAVKILFLLSGNDGAAHVSHSELFKTRGRSLLLDADVQDEGKIRVNTQRGCHLTSEAVLEALQERAARKAQEKSKS